jgi:sorting nexin-1/2
VGSGVNKHVAYHIEGWDSLGDIHIKRRFREFYLFKEVLFKRYPGLYIPPIPPKKKNGNKNPEFVHERMFFLNMFMKTIATTLYLAKTPEL